MTYTTNAGQEARFLSRRSPKRGFGVARSASSGIIALLGLVTILIAGCESTQHFPGEEAGTDPNYEFSHLTQLPDIDQATQRYQQMFTEIRKTLSSNIPALASWTEAGDQSQAGCGSDSPTMSVAGEDRDLPNYVVYKNLPDDRYEQALQIIGTSSQGYGFSSNPQRMHDATGDHDTIFHNASDSSYIYLGTAINTVLGISIGCHLTAEAKKRETHSP